jgi:hypothetical protein
VFNYARLPLSCFYGNPYLRLPQKRKAASVPFHKPADAVLRFHASAVLCE